MEQMNALSDDRVYTASLRLFTLLMELGISANLKGFRYLHTAVLHILEDPAWLDAEIDRLYEVIADEHHVSAASVERLIRLAIEKADRYGSRELIEKCFGTDRCPVPKLFITQLAGMMNRELSVPK